MPPVNVVELTDKIPTQDECGCKFPHDKTLRAIFYGDLESASKQLKEYGANPPYAIICDDITYKLAGETLEKSLHADVFKINEKYLDEKYWIDFFTNKRYSTMIGVGGGTILDITKYISFICRAAYVAVPTAPTNDGIASPMSVIFTKVDGRKTVKTRSPLIIIVDHDILSSAPLTLIASGIGDALAKITSLKDWELGRDDLNEPYCRTAEYFLMRAIFKVLESIRCLNGGNGKRLRECVIHLADSLISSGIAMMILQTSRPAAGSEHLIGRHLELNLGVSHGISSAFGTIIAAKAHELYNPSWWKEVSLSSSAIFDYCKRSKILSILKKYQIPKNWLVESIVIGKEYRPERYTILHKINPTKQMAEELLEETGLLEELLGRT